MSAQSRNGSIHPAAGGPSKRRRKVATPHSEPEDPYWESAHGHPGNPVIVDGKRWAIRRETHLPLLTPGATLLGLARWDERWKHPPNETLFVRATDGKIMPIVRRRDLLPHLAPIADGDQALAYVRFLRLFWLQGLVPGLPPATPERYGVMQETMEEELRAEGIDPTPHVEADGEAFVMRRLVVVRDDTDGPPRYRLVRVHERIERDGRYELKAEATVPTRADVQSWILRPL